MLIPMIDLYSTVVHKEFIQYENIRDGKVVLSTGRLEIKLNGWVSFNIDPGHPQYLVWSKKVDIGYQVKIRILLDSVDPQKWVMKKREGEAEDKPAETRQYYNLDNVELLEIKPPEIDDKFADLPDVSDCVRTVRKGKGNDSVSSNSNGSLLNTGALTSSAGPQL